jgi:hypothetical protein
MSESQDSIYVRTGNSVVFNQRGVKIEMDAVDTESYYAWLDDMKRAVGGAVPGAEIAEKENARVSPPLNTAIYYDTPDHKILPTGALLRTSCNKITHAFCAYKASETGDGVRRDHRYVFDGDEKREIQREPDGPAAVSIVKRLLARTDIKHPGTYLESDYSIIPTDVTPSIRLDDHRYTFFVWLDKQDALRCSLDRATVANLRCPPDERVSRPVIEVELAIYPRVSPEVGRDERIGQVIDYLADQLCDRFDTRRTTDIKYQRSCAALEIAPGIRPT